MASGGPPDNFQSRLDRLIEEEANRRRAVEPEGDVGEPDDVFRQANRFKTEQHVVVTSSAHLLDPSSTRNIGVQVSIRVFLCRLLSRFFSFQIYCGVYGRFVTVGELGEWWFKGFTWVVCCNITGQFVPRRAASNAGSAGEWALNFGGHRVNLTLAELRHLCEQAYPILVQEFEETGLRHDRVRQIVIKRNQSSFHGK